MTLTTVSLLLLKASLVLAVALGVSIALGRAHAAWRHRLWTATFGIILALPVLAALLPSLPVPVPSWQVEVPATRTEVVADDQPFAPVPVRLQPQSVVAAQTLQQDRATAWKTPAASMLAIAAWLAGVLIALVGIASSYVSVHRMAASSAALDDEEWRAVAGRVASRFGLARRVRVFASPCVTVPMAGGIVRPAVFVPPDAARWTDEQRDIVLTHEIAHIANGDPVRHLVARLAFVLYWFHPFVWFALRRASSACEQACDDAVLALGVRPSTYARVLLGFAGPAPLRLAALPMARGTNLETRLVSILDNSVRSSTPRLTLRTLAIAAVATATLAAAQPTPTQVRVPVPPKPTPPAPVHVAALPEPSVPATTPTPPAAAPGAPGAPAIPVPQVAECAWDSRDSRNFSGSISTSRRGGTTIIHEQVGTRGSDRVIQKTIEGLRVCAEAIDIPSSRGNPRPSAWPGVARRVVIETRDGSDVRRMTIVDGDITYLVNGRTADVDGNVLAWRDALFGVLDLTWDVSQLRGEVSTKRGEISSIRGEHSSLRGQISSYRGEVSSMQGAISSIRGQVSSMRGEISTIRGRESTLRGQISTEQGRISTLRASAWDASDADRARLDERIRRHRDAIEDIEEEIRRYDADGRVRDVEERIARFDEARRVAAMERQIRDYDLDARVARVNREIETLDVERRVAAIEREIQSLDADRRIAALEGRLEEAVARLRVVGRR